MASREAGFPHPVTPIHTHTRTTAATQARTPHWWHHAAASASLACSDKRWLLEQLGSTSYVSPLANFLRVLGPFCRKRSAHCAIVSFTTNTCPMQRLLSHNFHTQREQEKQVKDSANPLPPYSQAALTVASSKRPLHSPHFPSGCKISHSPIPHS